MSARWRYVLRLLVVLASVMVAGGCSRCSKKTDAELAAEERTKADDEWRSSLALLPWRAVKGAVRSRSAPNRPPIYDKVDATLAVLNSSDAKARTDACFDLLAYLVLHRAELTKHDEDDFPRLANVFDASQPPLPAPWYDNPAEHAVAALALLVLDATDKSDRVPARDIVFYELSRAPVQSGWPTPLRMATLFARGIVYLEHAYHYAAEEELGRYIEEAKHATPADYAAFAEARTTGPLPPEEQAREIFLAAGYFARAYNRSKLDRDEPMTADLEAGLASLDRLGVENELTLWAHAIVWQRQGRYDEAARSLDKLADSAYLDDDAKKDVRAAAADMRKNDKKRTWFHSQRTQIALVRAVIARFGGLEGIVAIVAGKEAAHRWIAPFTSMSAAREALREVAAKNKDRFGSLGTMASGAASTGKKTIGDLKDKLGDAGLKAP